MTLFRVSVDVPTSILRIMPFELQPQSHPFLAVRSIVAQATSGIDFLQGADAVRAFRVPILDCSNASYTTSCVSFFPRPLTSYIDVVANTVLLT